MSTLATASETQENSVFEYKKARQERIESGSVIWERFLPKAKHIEKKFGKPSLLLYIETYMDGCGGAAWAKMVLRKEIINLKLSNATSTVIEAEGQFLQDSRTLHLLSKDMFDKDQAMIELFIPSIESTRINSGRDKAISFASKNLPDSLGLMNIISQLMKGIPLKSAV